MTKTVVGLREYARHCRVSPGTVSKWIKTGRLERSVSRGAKGPRIDVSLADRECRDNKDPSKVRDGHPATLPDDPALPLSRAYDELLDLVTVIEERLSDAFRATFADPAARKPESLPAQRWKALYDEWGKIVPALEEIQHQTRAAVPALRAAS
jgi:hypothetical protein